MPDESEKQPKSWWYTLPGILTAVGGILTALTGFLIALHQVGFIESSEKNTANINTSVGNAVNPVNSSTSASSTVVSNRESKGTRATLEQRKKINLLSVEGGGHLISSSGDAWLATIDGKEDSAFIDGRRPEAVYAFKDERSAAFDMFTVLVNDAGQFYLKGFELFAANDVSGPFESLGTFETQNIKLYKTPYQQFKITPTKAKYLKVRLLTTHRDNEPNTYLIREFQLMGTLE